MHSETNCLVFDKSLYNNEKDFDNDMLNFIKILTHNEYTCQVIQTTDDIYEVWFDYCDTSLGGSYPRWMTEEEFDEYNDYRRTIEDDLK